MPARERTGALVGSRGFRRVVVAVIVANAVTLGLETSRRLSAELGGLLHVADRLALAMFVVELGLRT